MPDTEKIYTKRDLDREVHNALKNQKIHIYSRLKEMSRVYETMDTGSALKQLQMEDVLR